MMNLIKAETRINEVEANPYGSDSGEEWIELYSESPVDLNGWKIVNNDNQSLNLNQSFNGYFIISLQGQWLDNSDEKIFLYNGNSLVSESVLFSDSENNNKTWQHCNGNWNFSFGTKNSQNICSAGNQKNDSNNNNKSKEEISLSIDWDEDDIINGKEFNIEVSADNLNNDDYDIRVWIEDEDGDIISERYGEDENTDKNWKSGNYYATNFFSGTGDKTEDIKLRIKESFSDFNGDAKIIARIRKNGGSSTIDEVNKDIEILEKKNAEENKDKAVIANVTKGSKDNFSPATGKIIKLGNSREEIKEYEKENKGDLIYNSKTEKIKVYSFFGFALLCLILSILIVAKKLE